MDQIEKHKTFISSIVFLDIVGFSIEPVTDQFQLKSTLNQLVSTSLNEVEKEEAIVLDTGDGSAICFLGDPEVALNVAVWIQGTILELNPSLPHPLQVRFGINLGPVKILKDFNEHKNVVGDGINVAQRVMSFADPNQILVSRSFYEVISCLTKEHSLLFDFKGIRKDKHVREHSVYEVKIAKGDSSSGAQPLASSQEPPRKEPPTESFTPETLLALETVACSYLGPMAKILVRNAIKTRKGITELCETLSKQLTNEVEKKNFLKESLCLLQSSNGSCYLHLGTDSEDSSTKNDANNKISLSDLQALTNIFGKVMGPIAKTLIKREVKTAPTMRALCDLLAREITHIEDRERFLNETKKLLQNN